MKATELLKAQHREVAALFEKMESARTARQRQALLRELSSKLAAHMAIEQELFYPAAAEATGDMETLAEAFEEHAVAAFALRRLMASLADAELYRARAKVLCELIEHHVEEEEKELLPQAARALGKAEDSALGEAMMARFEEVMAEGPSRVVLAATSMREARPRRAAKRGAGSKRMAAKRRTSRASSRRKA